MVTSLTDNRKRQETSLLFARLPLLAGIMIVQEVNRHVNKLSIEMYITAVNGMPLVDDIRSGSRLAGADEHKNGW